jgi:hypothetical protein
MVFVNKVSRRIFGPKRYENREWRKIPRKEFYSSYSSPNKAIVIKSGRLRWRP